MLFTTLVLTLSPNKHFSAFLNPVGNVIASFSFLKCHLFVYSQSKLATQA